MYNYYKTNQYYLVAVGSSPSPKDKERILSFLSLFTAILFSIPVGSAAGDKMKIRAFLLFMSSCIFLRSTVGVSENRGPRLLATKFFIENDNRSIRKIFINSTCWNELHSFSQRPDDKIIFESSVQS